jgi:NTE family protein
MQILQSFNFIHEILPAGGFGDRNRALSPTKRFVYLDHALTVVLVDELKVRHIQKLEYETVLVMQGGGSLGAYECGVFKTLHRHGISFDVISGTSIGAINAGIIAGSKNGEPSKDLEAFWLEVAETITPYPLPDLARAVVASFLSATYGNPKAFEPVWFWPSYFGSFPYFGPVGQKPYLYELDPLKKTIAKYIDFDRLNGDKKKPRLIATCTDIKDSHSVVFDSWHTKIDADHLAACASFPFYGIKWTEKDGRYLWDGALLSNTPLREVIEASPRHDKRVYIVNLFPHHQEQLPQNLYDTWHRARDIMHTDRTDQNLRASERVSRYLLLLKEMHDILNNVELEEGLKNRFFKIEKEYHQLASERGAIIDDIIKIERSEDVHFLFEDADFSLATIKKLIEQGEKDCELTLKKKQEGDDADR